MALFQPKEVRPTEAHKLSSPLNGVAGDYLIITECEGGPILKIVSGKDFEATFVPLPRQG